MAWSGASLQYPAKHICRDIYSIVGDSLPIAKATECLLISVSIVSDVALTGLTGIFMFAGYLVSFDIRGLTKNA